MSPSIFSLPLMKSIGPATLPVTRRRKSAPPTEKVTRAERIRVRTLDRAGKTLEFDAEGLLAVCIQHEMDHLEGKLFVDYLSELKRTRIRKKLEKERKENAANGTVRAKPTVPAI